jgi:hypothetical protein
MSSTLAPSLTDSETTSHHLNVVFCPSYPIIGDLIQLD